MSDRLADSESVHVDLRGEFILQGEPGRAFELFSPEGEKLWVADWNPRVVHPVNGDWVAGMVFTLEYANQTEVWVVAELDKKARRVVYYRTEPGLLVARVEIRCLEHAAGTRVQTLYTYTGLTPAGNAGIKEWTPRAYELKMERWKALLDAALK